MPIEIKISLDLSAWQKRLLRGAMVFGVVAAAVGFGIVGADPTHTFSAGNPIRASEMNENFSELHTRLAMLETRLDATLITGGANERIERARLTAPTSCSIAAQSGTWIQSAASGGNSSCILTFANGTFASIPTCVCSAANPNICTISNVTTTYVHYRVEAPGGTDGPDGAFIICMGPR